MTLDFDQAHQMAWHIEARLLALGEWRVYGTDAKGYRGFFQTQEPLVLSFEAAAECLEQLCQMLPTAEFRLVSSEFQTGILRRQDFQEASDRWEGIVRSGILRR